MILRRFIQHIKEQNWFAVGLDVCVVIVGIFLGMQVTEWSEARKYDLRLKEYMGSLATEVANSKGSHEAHVRWQSRMMEQFAIAAIPSRLAISTYQTSIEGNHHA